ncbi:hypothetical protein SDC9_197224 [bioreactor metagenome]|uniref:Uncharacterized protein n=1 Tax=bioreactor metagenome TaxID=1076179 RepID=A0A645IFJ2_9ZZZZ
MRVKSWIKYFIYMCLIIIIVFLGQHVFGVYKQSIQETFDSRLYYDIFMIIFYGSIGLLLGLEHFIHEKRKKGPWAVNFPKIALMVVPSLYFSFTMFIYYNNIDVLLFPIKVLIKDGTNFITAFQIIFGYSIITSFYKSNKVNIDTL